MIESGTKRSPKQAAETPRAGLLAWAFYDWASNAFPTLIQTFVFAAYFTRAVAEDESTGTALWGNALGVAGILIALSGPVLGAMADQQGRHKPWIATFTLLCVVATALLWFVQPSPEYIWLALVLLGIGSFSSELAEVFYNAMLPRLVPNARVGRWSGWGWSAGYGGGLMCLVVALLAFVQPEPWFPLDRETGEDVRATFLLAAGWFLMFALPMFLLTPDTPSTRIPARQAVRDGLAQLRDTFRQIRHYRHIVHFLVARLIYSDGLATLFAFGGVYAAGTFDMSESEVLLFGIALNISAGLGAFGFAWVTDWMGSRRTVLLSLAGLMVFGSLILVVEDRTLFWAFGISLGLFVGPVQAASRALLASIAPTELRNQMFGLYAFSGRATAFIAPLLVGWITYLSGSQRIGMAVIIVYFLVGFVLMLRLSIPKGSR